MVDFSTSLKTGFRPSGKLSKKSQSIPWTSLATPSSYIKIGSSGNGRLEWVKEQDGQIIEEIISPEDAQKNQGQVNVGGAPINEMVNILGEFKKKIDNMEGIKQENETGMLSMIKTLVENQTNILKENGAAKTGKSV